MGATERTGTDFLFLFSRRLRKQSNKQPMIKKRKREVRKISAGDLVRFQSDRKLAEEGEKKGSD